MSRNRNKFCRLFNFDIEHEKQLGDAEVRIYHLFLRLVDWDSKHANFGSVEVTVRELAKEYLPWSIGKVSETIRSLIVKGWLIKIGRSRIAIKNYWVYKQSNVREIEQLVQQARQGVQISEPVVRSTEEGGFEGRELLRKKKEELGRKMKW